MRTEYRYAFGEIAAAVRDNFFASEFGMFPCEPNWISSVCKTLGVLGRKTCDRTHHATMAYDAMAGFAVN